jgi:hypothetical protein
MAGRAAGLSPRDLTARSGTPEVDRATWTIVIRAKRVQRSLRLKSLATSKPAIDMSSMPDQY